MSRLIVAIVVALAALLPPALSQAQPFPSRPIKLIVPYPAGGNTDIVARMYAQKLTERLGQPVVIENRGGAAGTIGVAVAREVAERRLHAGHRRPGLARHRSAFEARTSATTRRRTSRRSACSRRCRSWSPCTRTRPTSRSATTSRGRRAQPGKLTYGSSGVGAPGHLAFEQLRSMTGVDFVHVPFKGGAQAVTGILGEQVDVVIDGTAMAQVKAGKLRAIAVSGPRLPALPDVPGIGETVNGFEFTNWWGVLAPAGTPPEVVRRLNAELVAIAALPEVRDRLRDLGLAAQGSSPTEFADRMRDETAKVAKIVRDAKIKFE